MEGGGGDNVLVSNSMSSSCGSSFCVIYTELKLT